MRQVKRVILTILAGIALSPALLIYGLIYFLAWRADEREKRERKPIRRT